MLRWPRRQRATKSDAYAGAADWVCGEGARDFLADSTLNGKQPRVANMLVEDHLRPAAVKAGTPHLTPKQIDLLHTIWLGLSSDVAPEEIHHHDVVPMLLKD